MGKGKGYEEEDTYEEGCVIVNTCNFIQHIGGVSFKSSRGPFALNP